MTGQDIIARDNVSYHLAPALAAVDLEAALASLTPNTRRAYGRALASFRAYCDGQGWTAPTSMLLRRQVLVAWAADMRDRGLSAQTIRQALAATRWAAGLAADAGEIDDAVLAGLQRRIKVAGGGVRQGRWYSFDELQRLVRAPRGAGPRPARDRAALALLGGCALRRAELASLTIGNLVERDGQPVALENFTGKGSKVRSVAIPEWARPYVAGWLRVYRKAGEWGPDAPLICEIAGGGHGTPTGRPVSPAAIYDALRAATAAAGLPEIAPHDLRRTAARLMKDGGADLLSIRDVLGHKSVATTERYLQTASGPALGTLAMDRLMK